MYDEVQKSLTILNRVNRRRQSRTDRKHYGQMKKDRGKNYDLQNTR